MTRHHLPTKRSFRYVERMPGFMTLVRLIKKSVIVDYFLSLLDLNGILRRRFETALSAEFANQTVGNGKMKKVTVVIPSSMKNSQSDLCGKLSNMANGANHYRWRFIFVDDGSSDGSRARLDRLATAILLSYL